MTDGKKNTLELSQVKKMSRSQRMSDKGLKSSKVQEDSLKHLRISVRITQAIPSNTGRSY